MEIQNEFILTDKGPSFVLRKKNLIDFDAINKIVFVDNTPFHYESGFISTIYIKDIIKKDELAQSHLNCNIDVNKLNTDIKVFISRNRHLFKLQTSESANFDKDIYQKFGKTIESVNNSWPGNPLSFIFLNDLEHIARFNTPYPINNSIFAEYAMAVIDYLRELQSNKSKESTLIAEIGRRAFYNGIKALAKLCNSPSGELLDIAKAIENAISNLSQNMPLDNNLKQLYHDFNVKKLIPKTLCDSYLNKLIQFNNASVKAAFDSDSALIDKVIFQRWNEVVENCV